MQRSESVRAPIAAFTLTALVLAIVQLVVERPMLLAERFLPGAGWAEIAALSVYAAWVLRHMMDQRKSALWRRRIWTLFSVVFFGQLLLGLAGFESFLMTGQLHIPVPAMIVAGPVYRGGGLFMPILFGATVLLVGPAWCSHLCYIGAWDNGLAQIRRRPQRLPRWRDALRAGTLVLVVAVAMGLRAAGASAVLATALGLGFGLIGVALMLVWSRRTGTMAHCVSYCPIGLLAVVLGRISPFRLKIDASCTDCGACGAVCRYDALSPEDVKKRRPGLSCTLCGDCLRTCRGASIRMAFPGLGPDAARTVFLVLVVSLHAAFLGVARL